MQISKSYPSFNTNTGHQRTIRVSNQTQINLAWSHLRSKLKLKSAKATGISVQLWIMEATCIAEKTKRGSLAKIHISITNLKDLKHELLAKIMEINFIKRVVNWLVVPNQEPQNPI